MAQKYKEKIQKELDSVLDGYTEKKVIKVPTGVNDDGSLKYGEDKLVTTFKSDGSGDPIFKGFYSYNQMMADILNEVSDTYVSTVIKADADITITKCASYQGACVTMTPTLLVDSVPFCYGFQNYLSVGLILDNVSLFNTSVTISLTDVQYPDMCYGAERYIAGNNVWNFDFDMSNLPHSRIYKISVSYKNSAIIDYTALGVCVMLRNTQMSNTIPLQLTQW